MVSGAAEVLAALRAVPGLTVHDGAVPASGAVPYALVYFTTTSPTAVQAPDAVSVEFDSGVIDLHAYVHCVAGSASAARTVQSKVRGALQNARVAVAGRVCFPVRQVDDAPAARDESTGTLIMDLTDVYRLRSVPA